MPRQPWRSAQVRHSEYQGAKETVNICTHSLCFRSPNLSRPHTSRAAQQAMGEVQSRRDYGERSLLRPWRSASGWAGAALGVQPYSVVEDVGLGRLLGLSHPILQVCTESFLTATKEGACPYERWLKNTSTQIYLCHCWCVEPEHHHKVLPWPKRSLN